MIVLLTFALALATKAPPSGYDLPGGNAADQMDATCVQATALAIQKARPADLDNLLFVNAFYIGRLSGRATDPAWQTTADRETDKALSDTDIGPVVVRCGRRMQAILKPSSGTALTARPKRSLSGQRLQP